MVLGRRYPADADEVRSLALSDSGMAFQAGSRSEPPPRAGSQVPPPSESTISANLCREGRDLPADRRRFVHSGAPRLGSGASAAQAHERLELADAEQPARAEERAEAHCESEAERDDLGRQRAAKPRVGEVPRPP